VSWFKDFLGQVYRATKPCHQKLANKNQSYVIHLFTAAWA